MQSFTKNSKLKVDLFSFSLSKTREKEIKQLMVYGLKTGRGWSSSPCSFFKQPPTVHCARISPFFKNWPVNKKCKFTFSLGKLDRCLWILTRILTCKQFCSSGLWINLLIMKNDQYKKSFSSANSTKNICLPVPVMWTMQFHLFCVFKSIFTCFYCLGIKSRNWLNACVQLVEMNIDVNIEHIFQLSLFINAKAAAKIPVIS